MYDLMKASSMIVARLSDVESGKYRGQDNLENNITSEDLLSRVHLSTLVGVNEVCHSLDLRIVLVSV